jgi:nuclear GTP-binding protein
VWQYITLTRRIYLIDCPGIVPASAHDSQTSVVLKGVLRIEALPTPSEYIPALMERVKPVYLSRTYGVPLPDKGDPSISWTTDEFLDKLARMKGRLLKGGEPDIESVAKIILNDWVRGKIPFFVVPPERSEELNKAEAKKLKRNQQLEKGRIGADEERHITLKQNLESIMQRNVFLKEDVRAVEWEGESREVFNLDENSEERRNGKDEGEDKDVREEDIEEDGEEDSEEEDEEDGDQGEGDGDEDGESCEMEGAPGGIPRENRVPRM